MVALQAVQFIDAAQYVEAIDVVQWVKKAAIGFVVFLLVIFLLGVFVGFLIGKAWGKRSAMNDIEESRAESRADVDTR